MNAKHLITAMMAAASVAAAQPADAYTLKTSGRTLASPQLTADLLRQIAAYSKRTGGCSLLFSAHMDVMPKSFKAQHPTKPATSMGGHFEVWTVNACAAQQRFQIAMWPSPRGGADFAITPISGRMPLHAN